MTDGESLYLALVIATFLVFGVSLLWVTAAYDRLKARRDASAPRGLPAPQHG